MLPVCRKSPPEELDQFHIRCAADAGLDVLLGQRGDRLSPGRASASAAASSRSKASSIGTISSGTPSSRADRLGRAPRLGRGVARRHVEGAQQRSRIVRSHAAGVAVGDEQGQQRVAPAGERDADHPEDAGLLEVVADAQRQRVEDVLAELLARRSAAASGSGQEEAAVRRAPGRSSAARLDAVLNSADGTSMVVTGACVGQVCLRVVAPGGVLGAQARWCGRGRRSRRRSPRGSAAPRASTCRSG